MHIKYTKINYTLKMMKNLHSELFCEKTLAYREIYRDWQTIPYVYNTPSKEIVTNTGSTPGFK